MITLLERACRLLVWEPKKNWLGETPRQKTERRLAACEANLQSIWEHLNGNADR